MRKKAGKILAAAVAFIMLSGCGARLPNIGSRAIASAIGLVPGEEGMTVTVEYLEKVGAEETQRYGAAQGTGITFGEAVNQIEREIGHSIYLDNCRVLLVGGVDRRDQLLEILTQLDGDRRVRPLTLIAVTEGDPGELLMEKKEEETSVGQEFYELLHNINPACYTIKDCINLLQTPGRGLLMPLVEQQEDRYALTGFSPLAGDGTRWGQEVSGLVPVMGHDSEPVTVIGEDGTAYDLLLEHRLVWITSGMEAEEPTFRLTIMLEANLIFAGDTGGTSEEVMAAAAAALEARTVADYRFVLEEFGGKGGVDYLSLGKWLSLRHPNQWQKMENNWEDYLKNLNCEILASAKIKDQRGVT